MGIFRKRHAFRKPGAAPQKGQIETVLEQAVEENEREGDGGDRNARKAMIAAIIGSRKEHADPAGPEAAPHKHHQDQPQPHSMFPVDHVTLYDIGH